MIFYLGEFFESRLIYSERVMQPNVVEIIVVVDSHLAGGRRPEEFGTVRLFRFEFRYWRDFCSGYSTGTGTSLDSTVATVFAEPLLKLAISSFKNITTHSQLRTRPLIFIFSELSDERCEVIQREVRAETQSGGWYREVRAEGETQWGVIDERWELRGWEVKAKKRNCCCNGAVCRDGTVQSCIITVIIEYYYTHFHYLTS